MTSAPANEGPRASKTPYRDSRIVAEVRAEIARQGRPMTQKEMALAVFGETQAWLSRRLTGVVPFTPGELLQLADWLDVDVVQFLIPGKPATPTEAAATDPKLTVPIVTPELSLIVGEGLDIGQSSGLWAVA